MEVGSHHSLLIPSDDLGLYEVVYLFVCPLRGVHELKSYKQFHFILSSHL